MESGSAPEGQHYAPYPAHLAEPGASARPRRGWLLLAWFLVVLLIVALGVSVLVNLGLLAVVGFSGIEEERKVRQVHHSGERGAPYRVAVISIEGTILTGEGFFKNQIERARDDEDIRAIVLRVDSPGGTITGSDYIYHHLRELSEERDLPIVVSMGSLAASGGYYVSMACGDRPDVIFAEPTTWTGSIGVVIPHYNVGQLMESWGIEDDSIASGPLKTMGSLTRPMTDREREIFEQLVEQSFERFKTVIKSGRPQFEKNPAALDEVATGRIFSAETALEHGLVDRLGFIEEAIDRAIELSGLSQDEVEVVQYKPQPSLGDVLLGSSSAASHQMDLVELLNPLHPQAYYLWTHLPLAASSFEKEPF